ncbi:MAG: response regulator [Pirellulales bacterium]|nr:response regulator [Pirellulales bacterium]
MTDNLIQDPRQASISFRQLARDVVARVATAGSNNSTEVLADVLALVGAHADADHVFLYEYCPEAARLRMLNRWYPPGKEPAWDPLSDLPSDDFSSWLETLSTGKTVSFLSPDAFSTEDRFALRVLLTETTESALLVPMMGAGRLLGFLAIGGTQPRPAWTEDLLGPMDVIGALLAGLLGLAQVEGSLARARRERDQVFNATLPLCLISKTFEILQVNDPFCDFFGFRREEVVGKKCRDIWPMSPSCFSDNCPVRHIIDHQKRYEYEADKVLPDGQTITCFISSTPYFGADGELLGAVKGYVDITDRKRAEQETRDYATALETANQALEEFSAAADAATRAKSEFLANMSHEIRTPMTSILGFAENLLEPELDETAKHDALHTILRNGEYLLRLINDILDLSKVEAGKLELESIICSPIHILADVKSLMEERATDRGLTLEVEFASAIPESIQSDPTRLRQILINLVGNAIKFTKKGGIQIKAQLDREEDTGASWLRLDVIDSGVGMAEQQVDTVFDPFTQADETITRKFGGTGLGLAISRRMAEALGGNVTATSTLGEGSTFTLTVPTGSLEGIRLVEDPALHQTTEPKPTRTEPKAVRIDGRILLAEDGPDNQRLISFMLKKAGAEVEVAENGQIACDKVAAAEAEGNPFDLILMDMQMPELDGYAATTRLRKKGFQRPIIALTAHAMGGDREKCLSAGCDDYASKPIKRDVFLALIAKSLEESRQADS